MIKVKSKYEQITAFFNEKKKILSATNKNFLAFTLAEVLIALAVIGIVAALTVPSLISKINTKVTANKVAVINAKLIKGLNLTKISGEMNSSYSSTYDFVLNGLSKHLKMSGICDENNIKKCMPYEEIKYDNGNVEKSIKVEDIKKGSNLKLGPEFKDVAGFVLADGTPFIVSYNLDCVVEEDVNDKDINGCLAGIYDINGSKSPNKLGMKINTINGKETTTYLAYEPSDSNLDF